MTWGTPLGPPGQSSHQISMPASQTAPAGSQHSLRPCLEGLLPASQLQHSLWSQDEVYSSPHFSKCPGPSQCFVAPSTLQDRLPALVEILPKGPAACLATAAPLQAGKSSTTDLGDPTWVSRPEPQPNLLLCKSDCPSNLPALLQSSPRGPAACLAATASLDNH
jgi:hypothetical protein